MPALRWLTDDSRRSSLPTISTQPARRSSLPFLLRRRRRALTPPYPPDQRPRKIIPQDRCSFLLKLPYEIREQIYLGLLGNDPIQVRDLEERMSRRRRAQRRAVFGQRESKLAGLIALLQSCRVIYLELHPLLLTAPIISVPSLLSLRQLTSLAPPSHVHLIRSLHLHAYLPYLLFPSRTPPPRGSWMSKTVGPLQHFDEPTWNQVWAVLASMQGLRELRVNVRARDYTGMHAEWPASPAEEVATKLWEPLIGLTEASRGRLGLFDVEVSWVVEEDDAKGLPFVLKTMESRNVKGRKEGDESEGEESREEEGDSGEEENDVEDEDGEIDGDSDVNDRNPFY